MSWDYPYPSERPPETYPPPREPVPEPESPAIILPAVLFLATLLTTMAAGFFLHVSFVSESQEEIANRLRAALVNPMELLNGLPFCFTILAILLAHEMGHYLMCRYYGIRATLPYVIPAPPPFNPFGTFGAVIKIKSAFANRRQLFDVGIAGPLAGFVLIIPALVIGIRKSKVFVFSDPLSETLEFGEPLLFRLAAILFFPGDPDASISLHPIGWAAWFGMLATSLNLLPIGQLDGGHVVYSIFGTRGHRIASFVTFASLVILSLFSWPMLGYLVFAFLILFLGFRHPRPMTEFQQVDRGRILIALIGLIVFILTFIPIPIRLVEHVARL